MLRNRLDSNQQKIVKDLESFGCVVQPLNKVKSGCPDILVSSPVPEDPQNYLFEIKDGTKSPSQQKLTHDEQKWFMKWKGQVDIITTTEEALRIMGVIE